ncbi:MAG TPA: chorismate synthase [Planctomycetes bacterium]|nr:chorismate synthase [Planctomycetota bacterium]
MKRLRWNTAGESHGPALVAILEGMPSGLELDTARVDAELARRQGGYGRGGRMKIERDRIELLAGTKGGRTLASPIAVRIANRDATIEALPTPRNPRPGHADLAGCQKFVHTDPRAILERASARETAARVALGSIARQVLEAFSIEVFAHVVELGGERVERGWVAGDAAERRAVRDASSFYCLDPQAEERFRAAVDRAREERDSLGGVFEVRALRLPPGLGSFASGPERLTARLGGALFSIPAMKGVEFGLGFGAARLPGSLVHDPIVAAEGEFGRFRRSKNDAGGLEGGLTTGEELVCRVAMKPIPSLKRGIQTVDFDTGEAVQATYQRSDVTSVPAASVVGEAIVALELASAFLEKFGGDSMEEVQGAFEAWRARVRKL